MNPTYSITVLYVVLVFLCAYSSAIQFKNFLIIHGITDSAICPAIPFSAWICKDVDTCKRNQVLFVVVIMIAIVASQSSNKCFICITYKYRDHSKDTCMVIYIKF